MLDYCQANEQTTFRAIIYESRLIFSHEAVPEECVRIGGAFLKYIKNLIKLPGRFII
jgi:hypothetical protein